jgi:hypothetical protein
MKFKTRMINAAVAAALGTVAGAAQAVNLGNDGEGQVLIYPYYTTQTKTIPTGGTGAFNTLFTIVNSDSVNGKAVKVRFLEGKNSFEVLDFNLYLSPNDMWTGVLLTCAGPNATNGCTAAGAPMLRTTDNSCTAAEIPIVTHSGLPGDSGATREVAFRNFAYSGTNKDAWNDQSLGRAMEGYLEVIEMGAYAFTDTPNFTYTASLHSQTTQVPASCAAIRNAWTGPTGSQVYTGGSLDAPTGQLSGALTLINANEGTDASVDAIALDNFSNVANHQEPGTARPDLRESSSPLLSNVFDGPVMVSTNWGLTGAPLSPAIPVSAVLLRNQIVNEYVVLASPVGLSTDHVVTMPTKRFHQQFADMRPFTTTVSQNAGGICEVVSLTFYNRDETIQSTQPGFSPPPPSTTTQLCYEANVLSLASGGTTSNVLASVTVHGPGLAAVPPAVTAPLVSNFSEGWLRYGFTQTVTAPAAVNTTCFTSLVTDPFSSAFPCNPAGSQTTYVGLPVVGFFIEDFNNTSNPLLSYGTAYASRYTRRVVPQLGPIR